MSAEPRLDAAVNSRLRQSSLCRALTDSEFEQLLAASHSVSCPLGTVLADAGLDLQQDIVILLAGKLRLLMTDKEGQERSLLALNHLGEFVGGEKLESNISVRASADSVMLQVRQETLLQLKQENPEFATRLSRENQSREQRFLLLNTRQFRSRTPQFITALLNHSEVKHCGTAERISDAQGALAIVLKGSVTLESDGARDRTFTSGATFWLSDAEKIDEFNLPADLTAKSLNAVARSELLLLQRMEFLNLLKDEEGFADQIERCLKQTRDPSRPGQTGKMKIQPMVASEMISAKKAEVLEQEPLRVRLRRRLNEFPHIFQQSAMDCGAACLAMIATFYGKRVSLNYLRELCHVSSSGTSLLLLAEAAERLGFMAQGLECNLEGLKQVKLPCICFYSGNHYVVLYKIDGDNIVIGDPAQGLIEMSSELFEHHFSGYALELHPTTDLAATLNSGTPVFALISLLKGLGPQLRSVLLASLVSQLLLLAIPIFTQAIIDKVIGHQLMSMLNLMLVGMALACAFQSLVAIIRGYLLSFLSIQIDQVLMVQFYKHLLSLPLKFFEERSTGDLVTRFAENRKIREFLSSHSTTVLLDAATVSLYLLFIAFYNITFATVVLLYVAFFILAVLLYTPALKNLSRRVFQKQVETQSLLIESIRGIEKIKGAGAEVRTRWKWEIAFNDGLNLQFKELNAINITNSLSRLIHFVGQVALLWLGAHLVVSGSITLGQFMALNMMVEMIVQAMLRVVEMWDKLQDTNIATERILDVLNSKPEESQEERGSIDALKGEITFDSVTFRYTNNDKSNTLLNVSFKAMPGQQIAVVGRSGSGKSTLLKLLQGFYLPNSGHILIDGRDLTHLSLTDWRHHIGVVSQQEYFFAGTIKDNLRLYNPAATIEEIVDAAKLANIDDFVSSMPMGYDTPLMEGGVNLSGGQRQRLAIVRAILHNPQILIFDEATNALDTESETHIQRSVATIRKGRTMFVAAHRLSTVKEADFILVLDRGMIVETGTHEELLTKKGLYFYLCQQQLGL